MSRTQNFVAACSAVRRPTTSVNSSCTLSSVSAEKTSSSETGMTSFDEASGTSNATDAWPALPAPAESAPSKLASIVWEGGGVGRARGRRELAGVGQARSGLR